MLINESKKAIFMHNPKTGGASISNHLEKNGFTFYRDTHSPFAVYKDDYFKFVTVRNPYEKIASFYNHRIKRNNCGFKRYSKKFENKEIDPKEITDVFVALHRGFDYYIKNFSRQAIPQRIFAEECDFVMRYETLEKDFKSVCDRLSIEYRPLSRVHFFGEYNWRDFFKKQETLDYFNYFFKEDFEYFGYEMVDKL